MKRRPAAQTWGVALLSLLMLTLGAANIVRAAGAWWYHVHLPDLPLTIPLPYLAAMGAFWGAMFIASAAGLARFRPWGRRFTLVAAPLYECHIWLNHLLFDASDYARQTRPRDFLLSVMLIALTWGALHWPPLRRAFKC